MRDNTGTPDISEIQTSRPEAKSRLKIASQTLSNEESSVLISADVGAFVSKLRWVPRAEALPLISIDWTKQLLQYIVWTRKTASKRGLSK
jgi:hypothetical protein